MIFDIDWEKIKTNEELKQVKATLNSKTGAIGKLKLELRTAPREAKKELGLKLNALNKVLSEKYLKVRKQIAENEILLRQKRLQEDVFLGSSEHGGNHPLTLIKQRAHEWFRLHGYYTHYSKDIVDDNQNFVILNFPENHPARAMHDSLYFDKTNLLRTHNTGESALAMSQNPNQPFSFYAIGNVYRNDEDDATHSHQFEQIDLVSMGAVTINHLLWTYQSFLSYIMEKDVKIRLRPSYFPFTEPSVEVDMFFNGKWIEILGTGMMHPNVFKHAKCNKYFKAFAGGIGVDRLAMIKFGINDIRDLYQNDLRFLKQFNK